MPRFHRLAGAVALALGCAGAAQAQQFSSFIVFGDSLSDSGNIAAAQGLPPGNSFTTNPDPVFAEIIAAAYGLPGGPSLTGGPNFAWGGACVNAAGLCLNPVPNIPTQITQYLSLTGGSQFAVPTLPASLRLSPNTMRPLKSCAWAAPAHPRASATAPARRWKRGMGKLLWWASWGRATLT